MKCNSFKVKKKRVIVIDFWAHFIDRCPYSAVAELIYGKRMRIFVNFLLSITVFGAGVPNILVGLYAVYRQNLINTKKCVSI